MITSKEDYLFYLEADRIALGIGRNPGTYLFHLLFHEIWRFERLLRKVEYYRNCKTSPIWRPYYYYLLYRFRSHGFKLGLSIPPNVFGPGLSIGHPGTIVVNNGTRVGANCRIHACVVIGTTPAHQDRAPRIGNNVYIGPGAKIFGGITIVDGIAIGANAVVNRSFLEPNITIAGVPAEKVSDKGSQGLLIRGTGD